MPFFLSFRCWRLVDNWRTWESGYKESQSLGQEGADQYHRVSASRVIVKRGSPVDKLWLRCLFPFPFFFSVSRVGLPNSDCSRIFVAHQTQRGVKSLRPVQSSSLPLCSPLVPIYSVVSEEGVARNRRGSRGRAVEGQESIADEAR